MHFLIFFGIADYLVSYSFLKQRVLLLETLILNSTSPRGKDTAFLTWHINTLSLCFFFLLVLQTDAQDVEQQITLQESWVLITALLLRP